MYKLRHVGEKSLRTELDRFMGVGARAARALHYFSLPREHSFVCYALLAERRGCVPCTFELFSEVSSVADDFRVTSVCLWRMAHDALVVQAFKFRILIFCYYFQKLLSVVRIQWKKNSLAIGWRV